MSDMRKLINLFEAATLVNDPDAMVDMDSEVQDDDDGERLKGVSGLGKSMIDGNFPSVKQQGIFYSAWLKIIANKEEDLTQFELWELGRAFVDIVRMDEAKKMRLFRKLMLVRMPPGDEDEPTHIMDK